MTEAEARRLDASDPLATYRARFEIPRQDGEPVHYFCGNSLGLQPSRVRDFVEQEIEDWRDLAVHAHFRGRTPWYSYHEVFEESGARLVGARPGEVVMMNSLTVNLHLLMVSFYRPTPERHKILIENAAFPSDNYAVRSQLRFHGYDSEAGLLVARPRDGELTLRTEDLVGLIEERGSEIALVMLGGVSYFTGQFFDLERITAAAKARGCVVGFDLAHAAGNVPLALHDWNVDFAAWCNYKYLNGGPGAIAGAFVHEDHGAPNAEFTDRDGLDLPRFAGWWGNDPSQRFKMHLMEEFVPHRVAEGWQLSNPSIFSMAPLRASLELFDEVGMAALREKSLRLTAYLEHLLGSLRASVDIITPSDPDRRGCQLSLRIHEGARALVDELDRRRCVCDFREPDVIRVAPVPLYNTFHDVWVLAQILGGAA
ncbi:MAG: kynureninase [Planctomycetes bacterium]|nr:kynureninase [Planctomycetota bacterium]